MLEGMEGIAHFITGHVQTQKNRGVCCFHFFDAVLASKGSNCSELIQVCFNMMSRKVNTAQS